MYLVITAADEWNMPCNETPNTDNSSKKFKQLCIVIKV